MAGPPPSRPAADLAGGGRGRAAGHRRAARAARRLVAGARCGDLAVGGPAGRGWCVLPDRAGRTDRLHLRPGYPPGGRDGCSGGAGHPPVRSGLGHGADRLGHGRGRAGRAHARGGPGRRALLHAHPRRRVRIWLAAMCASPVIGVLVTGAYPVPEAARPALLALAGGILAQAARVSLKAAGHDLSPDRFLVSGPAAATTVAAAITMLAVHAAG